MIMRFVIACKLSSVLIDTADPVWKAMIGCPCVRRCLTWCLCPVGLSSGGGSGGVGVAVDIGARCRGGASQTAQTQESQAQEGDHMMVYITCHGLRMLIGSVSAKLSCASPCLCRKRISTRNTKATKRRKSGGVRHPLGQTAMVSHVTALQRASEQGRVTGTKG